MSLKPRETGWLNRIAETWLWLMIQISYHKRHYFLSPTWCSCEQACHSHTSYHRNHAAFNTKFVLSQVQHIAGVSSLFSHTHSFTLGNIRWWFYINDSKTIDKNPVNTVNRLWDGQSRVQILGGARDFSLLNVQIGSRAHTASYSLGTLVLSHE